MTVTTGLRGLNETQRATLEKFVARVRSLLEADFAAQAEGRFGIHSDGRIEDEAALPDDNVVKTIRGDLVEIIEHLQTLGETPAGAVGRLLREAAFTHLNRLFAIRIAEALDLLPESLANGRQSRGFGEFGEVMPILSDDYWGYLQLCGDELAPDVPSLFDPRNPLLPLAPRKAALDELVELLADPATADIWLAPDTLGWTYQFFNTGDERRQMREESGAPRNSRELAVRNQFFTPRYVVDFLVHNTLGRRLIEDDPTCALREELQFLVDPPTEKGPSLNLAEAAILDPACGSGHFLLGCYDVLERAWELRGVAPAESAPTIVSSLWGVDIDPRCAQVASAAIVLRARRHCQDLPLPRPNIVTARNLPSGTDGLPAEVDLSSQQRQLVDRISEALSDAPLLGPLLKAEVTFEQVIRHAAFDGAGGTLSLTEEAFAETETELLQHLQSAADRASSSIAERLLAAEADDALRFLEVLRRRYDVVLMNPPFGEPVPSTKDYIRATYPWMPKINDLLAAFVGRGIELTKPTTGLCGAITSRAGLYLTTFSGWREEILLKNDLRALADLGRGVMEGALVEAAAYVVARGASDDGVSTCIRLLKSRDRGNALRDAIGAHRRGMSDPRVFSVHNAAFAQLPGSPISYWLGDSMRGLFAKLPGVEQAGNEVFKGTSTSDDFRFVRTRWEVDWHRIGHSVEELSSGCRWAPFAKGGEYAPFWLDLDLVIDWEEGGRRIKEIVSEKYPYLKGNVDWVIGREDEFFKPGVTWSARTMSAFSPRALPSGAVFGHKGNKIRADDIFGLLAWLNTRVVSALIGGLLAAGDETTSGGASKSYEIGVIRNLPVPDIAAAGVSAKAKHIAELFASLNRFEETSSRFEGVADPELREETRSEVALEVLRLSGEIEEAFRRLISVDEEATRFIEEEAGVHPHSYPESDTQDDEIARLYCLPLKSVIGELLERHGGSRVIANLTFVVDRRLEVIAHGLKVNPSSIQRVVKARGLRAHGDEKDDAIRLLSYLTGAALGRWDVRKAMRSGDAWATTDVLATPPARPPGMLDRVRGGAGAKSIPGDYPLALPAEGLLVDEQGHTWDLCSRVRAAAISCSGSEEPLARALSLLDRKASLETYLRTKFFKDHLSRYSKSRRKAPIYWTLTVPSKSWGVWVYAPMLTRETLFAISREATRRERLAAEAITRLEGEHEEGGAGRPARKVAEELDAEQKLHEELRQFRGEAERIAGLGWEPDLDDGMVLCAAPLADLFPAWADAKKACDELRKGRYEWATVAKWADQL